MESRQGKGKRKTHPPRQPDASKKSGARSTRSNSLRTDLKRFTRQRILDAALECFRHNGFRVTTVDQIVDVAGMTVPTFYRYFPSKDDLLLPLQDHLEGEVGQVLLELDDLDITNKQVVRKWFDSYIVMWSRVHRLCEAFWEANSLDGGYAKNIWPSTLDTISVLENVLSKFSGDALKRFQARMGMMVLFMDRAALLVVAEESSAKANLIRDEFSKILWAVLNNAPVFDASKIEPAH